MSLKIWLPEVPLNVYSRNVPAYDGESQPSVVWLALLRWSIPGSLVPLPLVAISKRSVSPLFNPIVASGIAHVALPEDAAVKSGAICPDIPQFDSPYFHI